ncbi:helix-turn-helix domain-containing protein [Paracoccus benzoatiresistens]|uniref:XRE family transcriptional regulator n=1 Tax=Paracoccus benzoatiresistens TaxID=2997341 RepID=A0ABT4J7E3_9RHOB|nr:XRE family transcriptional regulator [Paracoccus sp. EF6]MCZ0962366.1 XRE family transcriptional regulator [Paracoccus sp. EF6]
MSDTLAAELEKYRIGPRLRELRLRKKLGLVQLSEHTGLSPAMLSKIERGQVFPTLPTLLRIALVFRVDLDYFFKKSEMKFAVTRRGERVRLESPGGASPASYLFESLDYPLAERRMEAFLAFFPKGSPPSEPHQHGVEEIIYVINGSLGVVVDDEMTRLSEGDAMSFDSSVLHSYHGNDEGDCLAIVVTVP